MKKLNTANMTRLEWLRARQQGIGGSDVGAIMGLSPFKSAFDVYRSKVEPVKEEEQQDERLYWGKKLENVIADHYAFCHPEVKVRRNNYILISDEHPFMLANLDRECASSDGTYILEIKTTSAYNARLWEDGAVPPAYVLQVQHYMAVTKMDKAVIVCLIGGQHYVECSIVRDDELIQMIIDKESEFWHDYVLKKAAPPFDGSEGAWAYLKEAYPESNSETVFLPDTLKDSFKHYSMLEEQAKAIKSELKDIERQKDARVQELVAALGSAEVGILGSAQISYRTVSRPEHTVKASSYRMFKVKQIGAGA